MSRWFQRIRGAIGIGVSEARHRFHELSFLRFAGLGAAGGLILGGLSVAAGLLGSGFSLLGVAIAATSTLLGAGSAAGTLAIARAGDRLAISPAARDAAKLGAAGGRVHRLPQDLG